MATASTTRLFSPPFGLSATRGLSRWWLNRTVLTKGLLVVVVPMVAFVSVAVAGLALQMQERTQRSVAIATNAVVLSSLAVLADATDGEAGVRGYAVTNDPHTLEDYNAARGNVPADVAALLAAATTDSERDQAAGIAATVAERFTLLAELLASIRANSSDISLSALIEGGKEVMDRLRVQVATLIEEPLRLVAQKRDDIGRLETRIEAVQLIGLVVGVFTGLIGIALFTNGISRRVRAAAHNASLLGQGDPLQPMAPAADELGQLSSSLVIAQHLLTVQLSELSVARDQALRATVVKDTFLSRTSHELRTPLNAILGFAQLLEVSELSEDDRESTVQILGAGAHLLALINELIDTSMIESGELRLSVEPLQAHPVVSQVVTLIRPLAAAREITVESVCSTVTLAVFADHQRLRQVLVNLASNAVKYNRRGGKITIGCSLGGDGQVEMSVSDTGPGLSPEEISRIFLPFERLESNQHGIEGTGIGLPLAGTTFFSAGTARSGIEMARRHLPDLILLDLHLPDLSGDEVFARLRAEPETAKVPIVVVLSADATAGTVRRLLARGAVAYLTKPLDLGEMRSILGEEDGRRQQAVNANTTSDESAAECLN